MIKVLFFISFLFCLQTLAADSCHQFDNSFEQLKTSNWKWHVSGEDISKGHERASYFNEGLNSDLPHKLSATFNEKFGTLELFPRSGKIIENAKANVVLLHGLGGMMSNSDSWGSILHLWGTPGQGKKKSTRRMLIKEGLLEENPTFSLRAIDLPYAPAGPNASQFETIHHFTYWLGEFLKYAKSEQPDVPFVVVTRSASPLFAVEVFKKYPGLIDKLYLMSPALPGNDELLEMQMVAFKHAVDVQREKGLNGIFNWEAINWFHSMVKQVQWTPEYMRDVKAAIRTGSADLEMTDYERGFYQKLSDEIEGINYLEIRGAEHNVLNTSPPTRNAGQFANYDILKFILQ